VLPHDVRISGVFEVFIALSIVYRGHSHRLAS